jgi:hypothetical protein
MEKMPQHGSEEPEEIKRPETKPSGMLNSFKKTLGVAGVVGLGYLGSVDDVSAKGLENHSQDAKMVKSNKPKTEQVYSETFAVFVDDKRDVPFDTSLHKLIEDRGPFKVYRGGKAEGKMFHYFVRDERYSETFSIDATDDKNATTYGRQFYDDNPRLKGVVDKFRAEQKDLMDRGLLQMPDGKHGIVVPRSEKVVDGKKIHTEVRYTEINDATKLIAVWEIGENNEEIGYRTVNEGSSEYDTYVEVIKTTK